MWSDDPDEDLLKLLIQSPRFRVGLLTWYIQNEPLWQELTKELEGSFPVEWLLTSKPSHLDLMDLRLGVLKSSLEWKIAQQHTDDEDEISH